MFLVLSETSKRSRNYLKQSIMQFPNCITNCKIFTIKKAEFWSGLPWCVSGDKNGSGRIVGEILQMWHSLAWCLWNQWADVYHSRISTHFHSFWQMESSQRLNTPLRFYYLIYPLTWYLSGSCEISWMADMCKLELLWLWTQPQTFCA